MPPIAIESNEPRPANDFSVLIVEDDNDARRNMEDILSLDGYRSTLAPDCQTAIEAIGNQTFDAVIVDWRLPDENADQLLPIVGQQQPGTPVVVVTGMRDFETAITALRSGAYDFLLKPINPDALRSVLRRIVERKAHLAALAAAQEKALMHERLAGIGQMVTGLAHESRNAFQRSHACLAELALDLKGMPESLELVHKIQKALDDLHFLLEEVRNYSAPIILERRDFNLPELVQETWQQVLEANSRSLPPKLKIEAASEFPAHCRLDRDRIKHLLRNLMENAFFASPDGGQVTVRLTGPTVSMPMIRLEVVDEGTGISTQHRETVFNPFFTTKTKGTGLGLAIARRYVEAHAGRLFVDPETKQGACFVAEIPVAARGEAPDWQARSHQDGGFSSQIVE